MQNTLLTVFRTVQNAIPETDGILFDRSKITYEITILLPNELMSNVNAPGAPAPAPRNGRGHMLFMSRTLKFIGSRSSRLIF